jgi:hypothetical protein
MASELLQSYYEWANVTETKVLDWVDPEGGWKVHPMADYPLANFASVFAICVGYVLFVVLGSVRSVGPILMVLRASESLNSVL